MAHVPLLTKNNVDNYIKYGYHPGQFVEHILCNNLREAAIYADDENKRWLADIAVYVNSNVPPEARGSVENIQAWMRRKNLAGKDPRD